MSALYAGSQFQGIQKSTNKDYQVKVVIHHVDYENAMVTGYLTIMGLAEKYSQLTTFFEGEIIGDRYSFLTRKWEADEKVDKDHWYKFSQFEPFRETFNNDTFQSSDLASYDCIFMRWKEKFLVPNHKVTNIAGASYDGFYYICFDKKTSKLEGFYYHNVSEKFQRLEMTHTKELELSFPSYSLR